ncbi:helix-turn-helix domain-containing protein [Leuconostoc mesenteroides]|uniref:helix-turn-helix domain-containing protein n=1 Tax=Leuconostoc mesenteroides TaxID=1245 RepID=UPI001EE2C8A2|nr:helix-turn-helix domain-containing protein [Leuconostoc mesenteroides]
MPTRYDKEFKQNIINLYKQGESAAQLAREYGIGYSTVPRAKPKLNPVNRQTKSKRWKSDWLRCLRRTKS